jgi:hypothetical protein
MPVLDLATSTAPDTDLEFVLQQLAALEPLKGADEALSCNGCSKCAHES